ncbi:hypothetical protein CRUP_017971, partial [Coryphaenoides rupestris]
TLKRRTMASFSGLRFTCLTAVLLVLAGAATCSPLLFNASTDGGSGDGAEPELLFPASLSTRPPASASEEEEGAEEGGNPQATSAPPSLVNGITTTMIRLKDFVLSRVVDFLQEYMLIIIVVASLLIVMVFIICCASAMSHKRKLEAYKPPGGTGPVARKEQLAVAKAGPAEGSQERSRPYAVDHVKSVQIQSAMASPKNLRMPSKALVGERGREGRSSPRPEVRKVRDAEEPVAVVRREEARSPKEQQKEARSAQQVVCTCHLKKAHH